MRYPQVMFIPPALASAALLLPHLASAYSSPHVRTVSKDGDWWYNYDFGSSGSVSPDNVDMPMTMLWGCEASIDDVKDYVFEPNGWHRVTDIVGDGSNKYTQLYENQNQTKPEWDEDKGMQTDDCEYVSGDNLHYNLVLRQMHTRLYAPTDSPHYDQMLNTAWSYYIVGSTHYDYNHADCDTQYSLAEEFGWPEDVENEISDFASSLDYYVVEDSQELNWYNQETNFWWPLGGNHFHNASGRGSKVCYK